MTLQRHLEALGVDLVDTIERSAAPAALLDPTGEVLWQNAASIALVGDNRGGRLVGIAPDYRPQLRTALARMANGVDDVGHARYVLIDAEGRRRRVDAVLLSLRRDGTFACALNIVRATSADEPDPAQDLTPRQLETLDLLADGLSTDEIAARLGVTRETARNYIRRLLRSLGARSRVEAVARGKALGLL